MATHSSILAWEMPWTEGSWWTAVHGITKSQAQLNTQAHTDSYFRLCLMIKTLTLFLRYKYVYLRFCGQFSLGSVFLNLLQRSLWAWSIIQVDFTNISYLILKVINLYVIFICISFRTDLVYNNLNSIWQILLHNSIKLCNNDSCFKLISRLMHISKE